ncbi:MAG TPA: tetratricopeptide repeat protein, partial [Roseiflexaceae bacterium]
RGGGTRRAVQAVTRATLPQLHALVSASLLQYDAVRDRYTVHELLRQYAAQKLVADPEDEAATYARHAAYFCAFLAERTEALKGAGQEAALRAIEAEVANLQAALAWAGTQGAVAQVDQALEGLGHFYQWRGRYQEGLATFAAAAEVLADADAADALDTRRVQAHALAWKVVFARLLGRRTQADDDLRRALAVLDDPALAGLDTRVERAFALLQLGDLGTDGRVTMEELQRHYAASLALYMELERSWEQSCALLRLGEIARFCGDHGVARRHLSACRAIRAVVGDRRGLAEALNYEAQVVAEIGATDEALDLARRSHAIYEELGDPAGHAFGLGRLGVIQSWAGLYPEAQRTLAASRVLYDDLGDQLMVALDDSRLAFATWAVGDLDAAWVLATKSIDHYRAVLGGDDPTALLAGGAIALTRGNLTEAARLLLASAKLYERLGLPGWVNWARSLLATTRWLLGCQAEARADLLAALRVATTVHDFLSLLHALLGLALIFAEEGAPERALELYALARQHPIIGNHQAFTTFFGQRLDAASTALPPEAAQAAQACGRERDLWATARELLTELEAAGWGAGAAEA